MIDKGDYERLLERKSKESAQESMTTHRIKAVGALLADKLSSDPSWAKFQQEAANKIKAAEAAVTAYRAVLLDPTTTNSEQIARAKIGMHAHQAIVDSYMDMLQFPNREKEKAGVDSEI